jgi:hypothetical protein
MLRSTLGTTTRRFAPALALGAILVAACADAPTPPADVASPSFLVNAVWDGNGHPAVGAMLYDWSGDGIDGTDLVCSGALIAPTVFLTAGHCVVPFRPGAEFWVTFDSDLLDNPTNLTSLIKVSSAVADPSLKPAVGGDIHDLAVLQLPSGSTAGITPVLLPGQGLLATLLATQQLRGTSLVQVGYGVSATAKGPPAFPWDGRRNTGTAPFQSLTRFQLLLLVNTTATGESGECYGDSGSPKFLPGTNTIVSVTSWGDIPCRASAWSYRLDTGSARGFLSAFVTLP